MWKIETLEDPTSVVYIRTIDYNLPFNDLYFEVDLKAKTA